MTPILSLFSSSAWSTCSSCLSSRCGGGQGGGLVAAALSVPVRAAAGRRLRAWPHLDERIQRLVLAVGERRQERIVLVLQNVLVCVIGWTVGSPPLPTRPAKSARGMSLLWEPRTCRDGIHGVHLRAVQKVIAERTAPESSLSRAAGAQYCGGAWSERGRAGEPRGERRRAGSLELWMGERPAACTRQRPGPTPKVNAASKAGAEVRGAGQRGLELRTEVARCVQRDRAPGRCSPPGWHVCHPCTTMAPLVGTSLGSAITPAPNGGLHGKPPTQPHRPRLRRNDSVS
jgi:hypothetical protein